MILNFSKNILPWGYTYLFLHQSYNFFFVGGMSTGLRGVCRVSIEGIWSLQHVQEKLVNTLWA